jgi:hypothetical protein
MAQVAGGGGDKKRNYPTPGSRTALPKTPKPKVHAVTRTTGGTVSRPKSVTRTTINRAANPAKAPIKAAPPKPVDRKLTRGHSGLSRH